MQTSKIDEKGSLKATEHHKYENIAGSVWLSLFMDINGNAYLCNAHAHLAPSWHDKRLVYNFIILNYKPNCIKVSSHVANFPPLQKSSV